MAPNKIVERESIRIEEARKRAEKVSLRQI